MMQYVKYLGQCLACIKYEPVQSHSGDGWGGGIIRVKDL